MTEPIVPLDPDRFERPELPTAFRGLDPEAVHALLHEAADDLRAAQRREDELRGTIAELEAALADARPATEIELEAAKARGRELVTEAQVVRRRILEDLARRRRTLRRQIEQLRAGRERLLESYEVIGHTMHEATHELGVTLPEAKAAAERAGRRVAADDEVSPDDEVAALEAEIDAARVAGLPIVAPPTEEEKREVARVEEAEAEPAPAPGDAEAPDEAPELPAVEPVVAAFEEVRVLGPVEVEAPEVEAPEVEAPAVEAPEVEAPEVEAEPEAPAVEEPEAGTAEVLSLFDRIRADADAEPEPEPEPVDEAPDEPEVLDEPEPDFPALALAPDPEPAPTEDEVPPDPVDVLADDLARRLRRELADEQNQALDRLRQERKGPVEVEALLGDGDALVARLATAVEARLQQAVDDGLDPAAANDLAHRLAGEVADGVREEVDARVPEEVEADEMARHLREAFREWRTDRLTPLAAEVAAEALAPRG